MRAMQLHSPRSIEASPLQFMELPDPIPAHGQLRVRIHCCAICHTDLHTVEGDLPLPKLPVIPGHQIVGTVDALGEGVRAFREGDRVGIPWLHSTCGVCDFASTILRTCASAGSLPATTWTAVTRKPQSSARTSLILCLRYSPTRTPPRCCARA